MAMMSCSCMVPQVSHPLNIARCYSTTCTTFMDSTCCLEGHLHQLMLPASGKHVGFLVVKPKLPNQACLAKGKGSFSEVALDVHSTCHNSYPVGTGAGHPRP